MSFFHHPPHPRRMSEETDSPSATPKLGEAPEEIARRVDRLEKQVSYLRVGLVTVALVAGFHIFADLVGSLLLP